MIHRQKLNHLIKYPKSTRHECTVTAWHLGREELLKENDRLKKQLNSIKSLMEVR